MSFEELPARDEPLSVRLAAAMRRAGYHSQRQLARDLETDGSLVGKWLNGTVASIKSDRHQQRLPHLLNTPSDYFIELPHAISDDRRVREIVREELERHLALRGCPRGSSSGR